MVQVTVIIPAYLNNEIGILDETLTAHAACEYRGPMTVMLMYNKKPGSGPKFREAERELVARWNGYGVRNLRCAATARRPAAPAAGRKMLLQRTHGNRRQPCLLLLGRADFS